MLEKMLQTPTIIPKLRDSSKEFKILKLIYEREHDRLFYQSVAYNLGMDVNSVRAIISRLRKKGLVVTWIDFSLRLTPAGIRYYEEYDSL